MIKRDLEHKILQDLGFFPAVALLGPRQVGKSTLAKRLQENLEKSLYLDLEKPSDAGKLTDAELFLRQFQDRTVILDEVQLRPEIFPLLRSLIDEQRTPGRFLLLGSASRQVINQSSESLAGRISFRELTPILPHEYPMPFSIPGLLELFSRGGFPESLQAPNQELSYRWREEFLRSYVERDLPLLGLPAPSPLILRLLQMSAHLQGQTLNSSKMAESLGLHPKTIRTYIDTMVEALLFRELPAWSGNLKKRLIKAPKIYIRDSGLAWTLLRVENLEEAMGHPQWGPLWEGLVIESALAAAPSYQPSYFRSSAGAEADLVLEKGSRRILIEAKASSNPRVSRGFWNTIEDLNPEISFVCAPVDEGYPLRQGVMVVNPRELMDKLLSM